jgi:hypothetical protein
MNIYQEFSESYHKYIAEGIDFLQDKNICITGLIKNGESHINNKLAFFQKFKNYCNNLDIIIYENDSTDNTVDILRSWASENINFKIISEKLNAKHRGHPFKDADRVLAMASYRNKCLDYIKTHVSSTYIIIIDLDYKEISLDGILNSFGWIKNNSRINIMAGFSYQQHNNGLLTNYDSWAYRGNWWGDYQSDKNFAYTFINWRPFIGSEPFQVNSAFGGICIYKKDIFIKGHYSGEDCEHVTFHRSIKDRNPLEYGMYVNPSQIMVL